MSAAPLPEDEPLRLDTLASYRILDTPPARSFDALVQMAAEHFNVPISLVSLVDTDRQWFKASVGLKASETPGGRSFCAHAILPPNEVFVVEDATHDPHFADNPLVLGDPSIRSYAGAPIRAENGQPLGTLCVLGDKVRCMDQPDRRSLSNLAASARSMLELHRKNQALAASSNRDPLTRLLDRRAFDTALAAACAGASADRVLDYNSRPPNIRARQIVPPGCGGPCLCRCAGRRLSAQPSRLCKARMP